eukprot:gene11579-7975_t
MNPVFSPLFSEEDIVFYKSTLYREIQDGPIGKGEGASMMRILRKELMRSAEANDSSAYTAVVGELMKVVTDSLMSAVHRSAPHELINRTMRDYHVLTDEEEYRYLREEGNFDIEAEETEMSSNSDMKSTMKEWEFKQRRKDDAKRKRLEDDEMLITEKKVTDEKGNKYRTLGPYPAPRLTVRSANNTFPSRKSLQHRTVVETPSSSSSSDEEELEEVSVPTSSIEVLDAKEHLTNFLAPLSIDSLKKVGESAKAKLIPSTPHDEFVAEIVKTAAKLGFEKGFLLIDKQKLPEDTAHPPAAPLPPTTAKIDYIQKLPESQRRALGTALGFPNENPPVADMWERMLAMGFLSVLTNLRLKPLKKIAQELGIKLPNTNSTEKFCEAVVFSAFPRERLRAKFSRAKQKKVKFTVVPNEMRVRGDMGYITFHVNNISMLATESDRHYSPEFVFAQMKWSLLCMANKDSLALYLCQTGSIHCKFLITVVNHQNANDSICNEGTQSFSSLSQENDWGFNAVIKFSELLNPTQGFIKQGTDTITIEVGIVLVEPIKEVQKEKTQAKEKKTTSVFYDNAAKKLLADEVAEMKKKKIKTDIVRTMKEEERTRKDIIQKSTKGFHDLNDRLKQDTKRLLKEIAEREKREELEEQKELEKIRAAEEQTQEMKQRLEEFKNENSKLLQEKKEIAQDMKESKRNNEKMAQEAKNVADKIQAAQQRLKVLEKKVETATQTLQRLLDEEPPTPSPSEEDEDDDPLKNDHLHRFLHEITAETL